MSLWTTSEVITAAKLNQKELYIGEAAPSNPTDGQLWYKPSTNQLFQYRNSVWTDTAQIALNKVKLPSPSASDYVTPSAAAASSNEGGIMATLGDTTSYVVPTAGRIYYQPYTPSSAFLCNKLGVNVQGLGSDNRIILGIYADSAGVPGAKLGNTALAGTTVATGWNDIALVAAVSLSASTQYWIIVQVPSSGPSVYYQDGGASTRYEAGTFGTLPDPASSSPLGTVNFNVRVWQAGSGSAIDDNTATYWESNSEANPWLRVDSGNLKILGGCRVYWLTAGRPTNYKLQVSEDASTWTDVSMETSQPTADVWTEYSWNARYGRYIRVLAQETLAMRIAEVDYYSRITDRVAAEHGHGSGVTPHLTVTHGPGHPPMQFGETFAVKTRVKAENARAKKDATSLLDYLEALQEELEFHVKANV